MDYKGAQVSERFQTPDDDGEQPGVRDSDHLPTDSGGIREGAEDIHDGGDPQLAADRPYMTHRRMEEWREHEDDSHLRQDVGHLVW